MNKITYQEIVSQLDVSRLIDTLKEMLTIRSENPFDGEPREGYREKEMGEYYCDIMSEIALETKLINVVPDRPNVFGILRGSGEKSTSLMLAGHMDTAPTDGYAEAYIIRESNNRIYGRGACDMKAALAAYMEVARILKETGIKLKGDLVLAGLCDEEYQMIGSKHVGQNGPYASQGIIGEPSNLEVCSANRGQLGSIIRTYGKSVHSSVQQNGVNAIVHMAKVIEAFEGYNDELMAVSPHPLLGHGSFNPGVIRGGTMLSTVPDYCELEIDRRFLPGETVGQIYQEYFRRITPLSKHIKDFSFDITEPTWEIPANDISEREPVVQALLSASNYVKGTISKPEPFLAGSDAPHLGFPTVICGPGSLTQAHSRDEYVSIDQLQCAVQIYLRTVLTLLL